jgi:hypothetical protein
MFYSGILRHTSTPEAAVAAWLGYAVAGTTKPEAARISPRKVHYWRMGCCLVARIKCSQPSPSVQISSGHEAFGYTRFTVAHELKGEIRVDTGLSVKVDVADERLFNSVSFTDIVQPTTSTLNSILLPPIPHLINKALSR